MKIAQSDVVQRFVKMLTFGFGAFLCVHFGIEDSPLAQTGLFPVLVCLTALALVIAALYQLAQGSYDLIENRQMAHTAGTPMNDKVERKETP